MAFAETQELAVRLSLKDNMSGGLKNATRSLNALDKATSNTQRSLGKFGSNIQKGVAIGLTATAGAFVGVVKAAADYESAFAGVRKTVDATEPELQKLSDAFRKLSKEIPISASELARLGEAGGALGIATADLEEFVRVTALLGVTTDLTSDQAATSLGTLTNVLNLTSDEYSKLASSLVALGNAGASTESQIIGIAERVGATGELIGLTTDQVLGFSSAVASLGIEVEAGGSALQKFFIDTTKIAAEGGDQLALMAKIAGTSGKQFQKVLDEDAGAALQRFLSGLGQLEQSAQLNVLEELGFNDVRITRTILGLANNTTLLADQMNVANKAFGENTALTKEAEQRFKTFDSQLQITKNVLTDIGITIGSKLLPKITPLLKRFNDFVNQNQGKIEQFGTDLASAFERVADAVGKVDWTPFIDGLKISAQLAKGAFDAFNALPDDFKKLILVGAGINKVTGGLITSVIKDAGKLAFDQFAGRGANPGNPVWVATVGGGLPGTPGAGGKGGGLAGAAKTGLNVVLPLAAAVVIGDAIIEATGGSTGGKGRVVGEGPGGIQVVIGRSMAANGEAVTKELKNQGRFQGGKLDQILAKLNPDRTKDDRFDPKASREGSHASTRLTSEELKAFRDVNVTNADLKILPQLLSFYKTSVHPSEKSIANDMKVLRSMEAQFLATGDTKNAATVQAAIRTLQTVLAAQEAREQSKTRAANQQAAFQIRDKVQITGSATKTAINNAKSSIVLSEHQTAAEVRRKKLTANVTVNATSYITVKGLTNSVAFSNKFGSTAS